uniref:HAT C-terminal dimerisation domain-containing protein n=1 Tax=Cyprinodon variegatus TaxID=28743 RepID=A0A3Q2GG60_CYPVA
MYSLCSISGHNLHLMNTESEKDIFTSYKDDLPSGSTFRQEVKLWRAKWSSSVEKPSSLPEILKITNMKCYPNIYRILHLLSVTPVTSASVERANSGLKAVKTLLRSTMGQERFVALLLLYVHKDIRLDMNKIIDIFAQKLSELPSSPLFNWIVYSSRILFSYDTALFYH